MRRWASTLMAILGSAVLPAIAVAGPVAPSGLAASNPILRVNSTGWGSRINQDRHFYNDEAGYYTHPRADDRTDDLDPRPAVPLRRPKHGKPRRAEPDDGVF